MANKRDLIADDNLTNVELLEAYLSETDYEIAVAIDGRDTLEKVAQLDPQCAIAWWGVSYAQGPNYNAALMDDNRSTAAWEALQEALQGTPHDDGRAWFFLSIIPVMRPIALEISTRWLPVSGMYTNPSGVVPRGTKTSRAGVAVEAWSRWSGQGRSS